MSRTIPTPAQADILKLLGAFDYLTTRQVDEYLGAATTTRATERKLKCLKQAGFVEAGLLHPERGAASERCWTLLEKGSDALGVPHERRVVSYDRSVTPRERAVLELLAAMNQLTTAQIRESLHVGKRRSYTWRLLRLLRDHGYIRGNKLDPERGAASQCYWAIRAKGAEAIGVVYHWRYGRHPSRQTIEQRGLLLELTRQTKEAGWSLIRPVRYSSLRLRPQETPQRRQLVEAVLKKEELAIENSCSKDIRSPGSRIGSAVFMRARLGRSCLQVSMIT